MYNKNGENQMNRLKELREDRDLYQKDIARIINVDQSNYSKYELEKINIPTLLVTANQSPYFNGKFADVMRQANPKFISHQAVDQSGHVIMAEQANKFNKIMDNYLKEHQ